MTILKDIIADYSPAAGSTAVPLSSSITIQFDRLMDTSDLELEFFVAGPDTDQFIGPGIAEFNVYPNNVSQGDDFLESPGYSGIVEGTFSFETVAGATKMTFTPSSPMAALTEYTAHLPEADDSNGTSYEGHITFSWTTGSGSIEALPDTASTSVLTSTISSLSVLDDLEVIKVRAITPSKTIRSLVDSVENPIDINRIEIELNKAIDVSSLSENVLVETFSATDHPSASASAQGEIATRLSTDGKKILIDI
jgi:hypothetical protein